MKRPLFFLSLLLAIACFLILLPSNVNGDSSVEGDLETIKRTLDSVDAELLLLSKKYSGMPPGELFTVPEHLVISLTEPLTTMAGPENCPTTDPQYCPPGQWYWTCSWNPDEQRCVCVMWLC